MTGVLADACICAGLEEDDIMADGGDMVDAKEEREGAYDACSHITCTVVTLASSRPLSESTSNVSNHRIAAASISNTRHSASRTACSVFTEESPIPEGIDYDRGMYMYICSSIDNGKKSQVVAQTRKQYTK